MAAAKKTPGKTPGKGVKGRTIGANSPTSEQRLLARQRQDLALGLRTKGARLQEIADQLGYASASAALAAVRSALDRLPDPDVRTYRKLYDQRYEDAIFTLEAAAFDPGHKNHVAAMASWIKIMDKLQKLHGTDIEPDKKPQKLVLEGSLAVEKPLTVVITELTAEERARVWDENREFMRKLSAGKGPPPGGELDLRPAPERQGEEGVL